MFPSKSFSQLSNAKILFKLSGRPPLEEVLESRRKNEVGFIQSHILSFSIIQHAKHSVGINALNIVLTIIISLGSHETKKIEFLIHC